MFATLFTLGRKKQIYTSENSAKWCYTPWKFQSQKPIPLETAHDFFLITPGSSTYFLIDPWKFSSINLPCLAFSEISPMPHPSDKRKYFFPRVIHISCETKNGLSEIVHCTYLVKWCSMRHTPFCCSTNVLIVILPIRGSS